MKALFDKEIVEALLAGEKLTRGDFWGDDLYIKANKRGKIVDQCGRKADIIFDGLGYYIWKPKKQDKRHDFGRKYLKEFSSFQATIGKKPNLLILGEDEYDIAVNLLWRDYPMPKAQFLADPRNSLMLTATIDGDSTSLVVEVVKSKAKSEFKFVLGI